MHMPIKIIFSGVQTEKIVTVHRERSRVIPYREARTSTSSPTTRTRRHPREEARRPVAFSLGGRYPYASRIGPPRRRRRGRAARLVPPSTRVACRTSSRKTARDTERTADRRREKTKNNTTSA